ncbi:MAG: monovalent cation/H(+) antiporter subunit G [Fimbriimonadaceae bacterium]|nr:monovalent cation/H(+) antiporter subunit G [Fimbriimonadaceae bacterium]
MIREAVTVGLVCIGAFFALLAVVGVLKHPDLFTRMQATTKASTLGIGCLMMASAVYFWDLGVAVKCLLVVVFFFITQPIAAHMLARAAYISDVPLADSTAVDELKGHYDPVTHELLSEQYFEPTAPSDEPKLDSEDDTDDKAEGW